MKKIFSLLLVCVVCLTCLLYTSWEKGLNYVAEGTITPEEYMEKLDRFVSLRAEYVKQLNNQWMLREKYEALSKNYEKK